MEIRREGGGGRRGAGEWIGDERRMKGEESDWHEECGGKRRTRGERGGEEGETEGEGEEGGGGAGTGEWDRELGNKGGAGGCPRAGEDYRARGGGRG